MQRRSIREEHVVNAVGLSTALQMTPIPATVAAPQTLWLGDLRTGLQVTPTDYAGLSFTANVNDSQNQGVGGLVLPEAGYESHTSEYDLRLSNNQPLGAYLLHQTRVGFTWKTISQTPVSSSPSLNVAGFTLASERDPKVFSAPRNTGEGFPCRRVDDGAKLPRTSTDQIF